MIKSFYEEPLFSGDFKREDLQEIDTLIQKLLRLNNGVGVVGGFYAPGLPVCIISELALQSLGYNSDEVFGTGYAMQFADRFAKDSPLREVESFRHFRSKQTQSLRTLRGHTRQGGQNPPQRPYHLDYDPLRLQRAAQAGAVAD